MPRLSSIVPVVVFLVVAVACTSDDPPEARPSIARSSAPNVTPSNSPSPTPSPSPSGASPTPDGAVLVEIPPEAPADDVDVDALAPDESDVTGRWIGRFGAVEQLIVAVAGEGDAFARDRALWRWTAAPSLGGWLGVPLLEYPARRGVLSLDVVAADVTGDSNDDVLVFALTGGSGACGTWSVVDLASTRSLFTRQLCDGSVDPSTQPVGLLVTESLFRHGDPHCCPSARRETVLTYDGDDGWEVFRRVTTPL